MAQFKCSSVLGASALAFAFGCVADPAHDRVVEQASDSHTEIHAEDTCDPVTFGALCRPGFGGTTTLAQFFAELDATHDVQTWEFGGGDIRVDFGQTFRVNNEGGETHSFTVVQNFGGGRVPVLNQRAGLTTVAPECVDPPNGTNVDIASGAGINVTTGTTGAIKKRGTFKVQCCIHPWMHSTVEIR